MAGGDHRGPVKPGPDTEPDFWGLLRHLCEQQVEFVIIGGFAVSLHGSVRTTKDVDIVPDPDPANVKRLWNALEAVDAQPGGIEGFRTEELPLEFSLEGLLEGQGNWITYTRLGRLDLMFYVEDDDGEMPFEDLRAAAEPRQIEKVGQPVWVVSLEHLTSMKEHAGRDQDLQDVKALRKAHGLEDD